LEFEFRQDAGAEQHKIFKDIMPLSHDEQFDLHVPCSSRRPFIMKKKEKARMEKRRGNKKTG
jgi:hypothetical protein